MSRWETGETVPGTDTLKLLSQVFDVSVNTILGSPRTLFCQCCGMPLDDSTLSREPSGEFNEEYCKWCYTDGNFTYSDLNTLIDFCAEHMASSERSADEIRTYLGKMLPNLNYWKNKSGD